MGGNDFWDAAERMARVLHEQALKVSEAKHQRNLERRRRRYAIAKSLGLTKRKAKPEPVVEYDYEPPMRCTCQEPPYAPPCSWCESQGDLDAEAGGREGEADRG